MSDDRVLQIERVLRAEQARVFAAWTDPAQIVQWWGPEGMSTPISDIDMREGGAWSTTMQNKDGGQVHVSGVYKKIDPPRHLAFTWAWQQDDGSRGHETTVEVDLEPVSEGTKLTLRQQRFESVEQRDGHRGGWESSFNDLERFLETAAAQGSPA